MAELMTTFNADVPFEDMEDDNRLEFIQRERLNLLTIITHDAEGQRHRVIDTDGIYAAKAVLKDMSTDIFTKKRLTTEAVNAETDKMVAELAEKVIMRDTATRRDKQGPVLSMGPANMSEELLPNFEITEGEISAVGNEVDLDEIRRLGRAHFKGESED